MSTLLKSLEHIFTAYLSILILSIIWHMSTGLDTNFFYLLTQRTTSFQKLLVLQDFKWSDNFYVILPKFQLTFRTIHNVLTQESRNFRSLLSLSYFHWTSSFSSLVLVFFGGGSTTPGINFHIAKYCNL